MKDYLLDKMFRSAAWWMKFKHLRAARAEGKRMLNKYGDIALHCDRVAEQIQAAQPNPYKGVLLPRWRWWAR